MIIFVRHGQSTANVDGLLVGHLDVPLTDEGRRQARMLEPHLRTARRIISSPLRRALETAKLAAPHLEVEIDPTFIELNYGTLEGTPMSEVSDEQWQHFFEHHDFALGGAESLADVDRRVAVFMEGELANPASLLHEPDEHLVIVSHVSPIKSAFIWALGAPGPAAWRSRIDNCSLTMVTSRRGRAHLVRLNHVV